MTIKRRLFISNILMIVLPVLIAMAAGLTAVVIFLNATGTSLGDLKQKRIIYANESEAAGILAGNDISEVQESVTVYKTGSGDYLIVYPDSAAVPDSRSYEANHWLSVASFFLMVVVVYVISRTLSRKTFKSLMDPVDILVNGVHEIRDGNLSYRIEYQKKDEFDAVCNDFNEMAVRLQDMVNQRQKDEQNRRELIAGISHDLRTPLTSMKAYIEGIEKGVANTPQKQKKYFETIKSKTAELEYIINQLFLFSKLDVGEFPFHLECVDIVNELNDMVAEFTQEYSEKGLLVSVSQNTQNAFCEIDTIQFKNVIQNLLNNSAKYGNKDMTHAEISCSNKGDRILVSVSDDGPGVADNTLDKLFDVFYRTDESRTNPDTGSGLGLAIAAKIIERMNGTIFAENRPEGGLKISIALPKMKGDSQ